MLGMEQHLYAGWFVADLRLLLFISLISFFLTTSVVTLFVRHRRWHEYVTITAALFLLSFLVLMGVFNLVADYPVFRVESFFPFP